MTRSYFSNLNCSVLRVFADLASLIWVSRTVTEVNNTVKSCWQAFIPKAVAICVFPVPGFPYRTRFLPCLMTVSYTHLAVWTIYHALDSDVADPFQAYLATSYIDQIGRAHV